MKPKPSAQKSPGERVVQDIRRTTIAFFLSRLLPTDLQLRQFPGTSIFAAWERARPVSTFVGSFQRGGFYFLHSMSTHNPALLKADGRLERLRGPLAYHVGGDGKLVPETPYLRARLKDQMKFADRELGRVVAGLRSSGLWNETTFVVVADHGSCWTRPCNRAFPELTTLVEPSLLRVPLIVHSPSVRPAIDARPVSLEDL